MLEYYRMIADIKKFLQDNKIRKYLLYILGLTVVSFIVITRSIEITNFIVSYHTVILAVAVFVLLVALLIQRKQTGILLENERLYCELRLKQNLIDRDMAMARNIQQGILNEKIPKVKNVEINAFCLPAKEIGGDFFGFKKRDHSLHFFLGDVSGHGISSALLMSLTNGLIQEIIKKEDSPARILSLINTTLCKFLQNNINFVTMFYGKINLTKKQLCYSSAGHHPGLIFRKGKDSPIKIFTHGTMLGRFKNNHYLNKTIPLAKGDKLFVFTDGFLESRDKDNKELGESSLISLIQSNISLSGKSLKNTIYKKFLQKAANINDDLTMIILGF